MDPDSDIKIEEIDNGPFSSNGRNKVEEVKIEDIGPNDTNDENYDDEPEETLSERLLGLTEAFPEPVQELAAAFTDLSAKTISTVYQFTCNAFWIFFTSSMILCAPVIFETERAQIEEMQKSQQKQVLLGTGAAGIHTGNASMPPMPSNR